MAEQRFRFRLPWLSAATSPAPPPRPTAPAPPPPPPPRPAAPAPLPRPTAETQQPRPAAQIQPPAQPTTTAIPSQRPPFRPAGIASPQPTPQATRTEPQSSQPSRAANELRVASQSSSPSRPTQTRAASVLPSPSRGDTETRFIYPPVSATRATLTQTVSQTKFPSQAATQPRAASVPPSPSRTATQGGPQPQSPSRFASRTTGQTSSQPSSPLRRATQVQPPARAVSQPPSPPKKPQPVIQETSRPPLNVIQPPSSIPREQELKPTATLQPTQEQQPKTQIKSAIVSESQYRISRETTFKPDRVAVQPIQGSAVAPQKFESISSKAGHRERASLYKEIRDDFCKFAHKLAIGHPKLPMDGKPVSIITVAGENRGASMHIGSESAKKDGSVPIHRGYKMNSSEIAETTTDGEGSSKERIPRDHKAKKDQATRTYINSNTQSINNSILFSSSVTERNPGVQLALSHNPAEPIKSATESESIETRKAQFSVTPAENLTYQPTVRRRCLRGLFMEPSDSDPDNPDKLRRHGCLYNCGEKSEDKEIGVL